MNASVSCGTRLVLIVLALGPGATALGGQELPDEVRSRANIAKVKIRTAAEERGSETRERSQIERPVDASRCASQSIGNIASPERLGAGPREVFATQSQTVNIGGRGGCR